MTPRVGDVCDDGADDEQQPTVTDLETAPDGDRRLSVAEAPAHDDARRRHYAEFYGLADPGDGFALVMGNCQAESLRLMLGGADLPTVRIPAVHELVADDIPHLDRLLGRARLLVSQPIRDDYHQLPLGTRQLASRLAPAGRLVIVPAIRHTALFPAQAVVRIPEQPAVDPPLAPYHDLRLLARALGAPAIELTPTIIRAMADISTGELRRREQRHDTVIVSDLFATPRFEQMRTFNHPGNPVFARVAERVRVRAGLVERADDPGRPLLNSIHAPREAAVLDAWGLDGSPTTSWVVDGVEIAGEEVERAHLAWYAAEPAVRDAAAARHAEALTVLTGAAG